MDGRISMSDGAGAGADACLRCGNPLTSTGIQQLRIGGSSGGWKLFFGELAELGEDMLPLEVLACNSCRRVEFRMPSETDS
jgi:hypothetical protein